MLRLPPKSSFRLNAEIQVKKYRDSGLRFFDYSLPVALPSYRNALIR